MANLSFIEPVILDKLISITTKQLRKLHFFDTDGYKSEVVTWKSHNPFNNSTYESASMTVSVSIQSDNLYVEFGYLVNGKEIINKVELTQVASNLGKGFLWYFICPITAERCRKLFLHENSLVGRKGILGAYYSEQVRSRKRRFSEDDKKYLLFNKITKNILKVADDQTFKRHYRGVPTKRYFAFLKSIEIRKELRIHLGMKN